MGSPAPCAECQEAPLHEERAGAGEVAGPRAQRLGKKHEGAGLEGGVDVGRVGSGGVGEDEEPPDVGTGSGVDEHSLQVEAEAE
ncbi:MAG: hypothetical protein C4307_00940 [Chloroflexota bacterium]